MVRVPMAPAAGCGRSRAAFRSDRPMGVSPLGRTAATARFSAARSSPRTGRTRRVSVQPCGRSAPYTRRPVGWPSGRASTTVPTAARALSIRVRPAPSSSPMEPDESSTMTRLPLPPDAGASEAAPDPPGAATAGSAPATRANIAPPINVPARTVRRWLPALIRSP